MAFLRHVLQFSLLLIPSVWAKKARTAALVLTARKDGRKEGDAVMAVRQTSGQGGRDFECGNTRSNSIVIAFEGPVSAAGGDAGEGREDRGGR